MIKMNRAAWSYKTLLFLCLAVMFLMQVFMVFRFELNWDEFLMLDWVYDWRAEEIILPFQTIFLRAFSWLPLISDSEITQIIAARCIMLLCLITICACLHNIAKRFFSTEAALLSVVAFLSFSFVFRNATSFRMDTIVTTVLMLVLLCVTAPKFTKWHIVFSGIAVGLAGMITIKAIFYVPTIGIILLCRWAENSWSRKTFLDGLSIGLLSLVSFAFFYLYHTSSLPAGQSGPTYLSNVVGGSLIDFGLFPSIYYIAKGFIENLLYYGLIFLGIFFTLLGLSSKKDRIKFLKILSFGIPLLTLIFYLHGFPYYYTFMLAPVSVLIGSAVDGLQRSKRGHYLFLVLPVMALAYGYNVKSSVKQTLDYQAQIIGAVHKIFPEPVNFIDRSGMVSSYNQVWFFMATWQMREYYKASTPIAAKILEKEKPAFILANIQSLDLDNLDNEDVPRRLLPEDEATLKANYIHHWGPIYVLGKSFKDTSELIEFDILVAGEYTLEATGPVVINDKAYSSGVYVQLEKGRHQLRTESEGSVTLRWGRDLYRPVAGPKGTRVFWGFKGITKHPQ